MRDIWAQGAAQGVWKEMQASAVGGREEMVLWNWGTLVTSVTSDIVITVALIKDGEGGRIICKVSCRQQEGEEY